MSVWNNALPAEGGAKPTPTAAARYEIAPRDRRFLALTLCFCLLLVNTLFSHGPTAGLTAAVFCWYALVLSYTGTTALAQGVNRVLLLSNLSLAATFALGSSWPFRLWNLLALLVLLPVHAAALSGAARLPWHRPAMLWERFCLLLLNLFGALGAAFAALSPGGGSRVPRRTLAAALGTAGALALLGVLVPVLASGDALFAASTAALRSFVRVHFAAGLGKLLWALCLTPFCFSLLYRLRRPLRLTAEAAKAPALDPLIFLVVLAALDGLYLLFLAVQSAGLFGGAAYLAQRGIRYAEWARSGFFQMVGVTLVNLTALLAALWAARPGGRSWKLLRLLAAVLVGESLVLLASAAWRMTLYVSAYGLSFKRCMTYWGMGMMALFFLAAARKVQNPAASFCRLAFPLALAGWLAINCVPVDYLVARNQVDRYLDGESPTLSVHYLAYSLSYDALSQLERLDGSRPLSAYEGDWWGRDDTLAALLSQRRASARAECADWRTWSLSACLAARGGDPTPRPSGGEAVPRVMTLSPAAAFR